jgi:hypothetical protein
MAKRRKPPKIDFERCVDRARRRFLRAVYRVLHSDDNWKALMQRCRVKDRCMGWFNWEENEMVLDWRGPILPTFIHECLHIAYPGWDDGAIEAAEMFLGVTLSNRQARNLYRAAEKRLKAVKGNKEW